MGKFIDITGKRYGKLTVLGIAGRDNGIKWLCKCDCGNTTVVKGNNLKNGHTASCGCARNESPENLIDLKGQRFGRLVVIKKGKGRYTKGGNYKCTWLCQCDCGSECEADAEHLRNGHTTSCGCLRHENKGSQFEDITGRKFERLTVIRFLGNNERDVIQRNWLCQCDCGRTIKANAYTLKQGLLKSCGCLKEEMKPWIGEISKKYKYSNKRLYSVYKAMVERCTLPKCRSWHNYGGRGVKVCPEWLGDNGYDAFAEWALSHGYDPDAPRGQCTIERIDTNGNYCPENCTWKTNQQQQNNRRGNIVVEYNGETHTLMEWSTILGIRYSSLRYHYRLKKRSIDEIRAIFGK